MAQETELAGGCHCGAVRYRLTKPPVRNSLCHCSDCRRHSGAPLVAWLLADEAALNVTGAVADYASSPGVVRQFCPGCGTGLFYRNATIFPGQVDIQTATLDDPDSAPAPAVQVQTAERLACIAEIATIPAFERYPTG
jgi:hypothetical protein